MSKKNFLFPSQQSNSYTEGFIPAFSGPCINYFPIINYFGTLAVNIRFKNHKFFATLPSFSAINIFLKYIGDHSTLVFNNQSLQLESADIYADCTGCRLPSVFVYLECRRHKVCKANPISTEVSAGNMFVKSASCLISNHTRNY